MGGEFYERDVIASNSNTGFSAQSAGVIGQRTSMDYSMNPIRFQASSLVSNHKNPIVFALDVTGSMGDWAKVTQYINKQIIYDKMPMLYGQLMMKNYLEDPSICFCAIGDTLKDTAPLQVSDFAQRKEIDNILPKIWLEGGGGNNQKESYEFAAYFFDKQCELSQAVIPYLFITGDEGFYPQIDIKYIRSFLALDVKGKNISTAEVFKRLMKKFNVFLIKKEYSDIDDEMEIYKQWVDLIGKERVLSIRKPKSCVDIILGAIAITSGARDLEGYIKDLKDRDQNDERINEVAESLKLYAQMKEAKQIRIVYNRLNEIKEEAMKLIESGVDREKTKYYQELTALRRKLKTENIPARYICPIMKEMFLDPVTAADGNNYERKAFEIWIKKNKTSPLDDLKELSDTNTKNNIALRKEIQAFNDNPKLFEKKEDKTCLIF